MTLGLNSAMAAPSGFSTPSFTDFDEKLVLRLRESIERAARTTDPTSWVIRRNSLTADFAPSAFTFDVPHGPEDVESLPTIAPEEIEEHRGEWVILHRGHVVAHAPVPDTLFGDPRASQIDYTLYLVPSTQRRFR